jgi:hypothetical protein
MVCIRALNPKGAYAMGWSLMFVLGFPWVWGFLNFLLASGLSLLIFGLTQSMPARSPMKLFLLLAGQPIVFFCHAIGGLILPIMVVAATMGEMLDARKACPANERHDPSTCMSLWDAVAQCWPVVVTAALIIFWKMQLPATVDSALSWDFHAKRGMLQDVLRDQWEPLDMASALSSYALVVAGICLKARWNWRQGLPACAMIAFYMALPARINGSQAVDVRMLSVVIMIVLGLQDWSRVQPRLARAIGWAGAILLAIRLVAITIGFIAYSHDYTSELQALDHVEPGTRIFELDGNSCSDVQWRMSRHDNLASLASLKREVWINKQWSIPGLDMLESRYNPAPDHPDYLSAMVWDPRCAAPDRPGLEQGIAHVPYSRVDYLWLLDTGVPPGQTPPGSWSGTGIAATSIACAINLMAPTASKRHVSKRFSTNPVQITQ